MCSSRFSRTFFRRYVIVVTRRFLFFFFFFLYFFLFFFCFQAEDGIRDVAVTGVQTCALPICQLEAAEHDFSDALARDPGIIDARIYLADVYLRRGDEPARRKQLGSEERRVGKEGRSRGAPEQ